MANLNNKRITRKLSFSFCLLILIFFLFGLYTLFEIRTISNLTSTIYNHPLAVSNAALQSNVSITKMHRNMKDVVLFKNPMRIQLSIQKVNFEEQLVYKQLDIVKNKILGDEGKKLEEEARILFNNWKPVRDEVISLVHQGKIGKAAEITIGKGANHVAKLEEKMLGLTNYARIKASEFMGEAEKKKSRLKITAILFFLLVIIISSLIAFLSLKQAASAEKTILDSEERLNLVIKGSNDAPWDWDLISNELYYSPQWWDQVGYAPEELPADAALWERLMHPEDVNHVNSVFRGALKASIDSYEVEFKMLHKDGHYMPVLSRGFITRDEEGNSIRVTGTNMDLSEQKKSEQERERLISELQKALTEVKALSGLLPICSHCKKIRDDKGYWNQIESYIQSHSEAKFSHGICQECIGKYYSGTDLNSE